MENPLSAFFPVEEREDGVYITVTREKRDQTNLENVRRTLDAAKVTNYQMDTLKAAFSHGRGAPERIGPAFEYYNDALEKYVSIRTTDMRAYMNINSGCIAEGVNPSVGTVLFLLARKGFTTGVKQDAVEAIVTSLKYDTDVVVAEGYEPTVGENAKVCFEIELAPNTKPQMRADGTVDFRDIQSFVQIAQGQVLARKAPPTAGVPGKTVTGREIPSQPGHDVPFPGGANTFVSQDGQCLMSAKAGVLKLEGNLITVAEMLSILRDVDYSVGNIKYSGDLVIAGDVKPGFTVEAEGSITVKGVVESATVRSRNGSVTIVQGVFGKGDAAVYGRDGVTVGFAQETAMESEGTITVSKHCLHCMCKCSTFTATERQSSVVGGEVKATRQVEATQIGNEQGIETRIILVDKNKMIAEEKLKELQTLRKKLEEKVEPIKKQVQSKAAIMKKAGDALTDRQRAEMKKWIDEYNAMNMKLKYVVQKIADAETLIRKPTTADGFVRVSGDIHPGAVLTFYGMSRAIQSTMTGKCFRMGNEGVES